MAYSPIGHCETPTAYSFVSKVPLKSLMAPARMEIYDHDVNKHKSWHYFQGTELSPQRTHKVTR